jgi:uncharacterized protein
MTPAAGAGIGAVAAGIGSGAVVLGVGAVKTYQWTVRPLIGPHCRFWPSCSDYAIEALRRHGAAKGSAMAAKRILRCNPWHPGGYDPVPGTDRLDGGYTGH